MRRVCNTYSALYYVLHIQLHAVSGVLFDRSLHEIECSAGAAAAGYKSNKVGHKRPPKAVAADTTEPRTIGLPSCLGAITQFRQNLKPLKCLNFRYVLNAV